MKITNLRANLAKEPKFYKTKTGNDFAVLNIFEIKIKDKKETKEYFDVLCFGAYSDMVMNFNPKTNQIIEISGEITASGYQASDGKIKGKISIIADKLNFLVSESIPELSNSETIDDILI